MGSVAGEVAKEDVEVGGAQGSVGKLCRIENMSKFGFEKRAREDERSC